VVFRTHATLAPLYEQLSRQAVLYVKAEHIATSVVCRDRAARGRHRCWRCRACGRRRCRVGTFQWTLHHRKVEHRKGPPTWALAPVKKSIYSLPDLREILVGCEGTCIKHRFGKSAIKMYDKIAVVGGDLRVRL
jgi:hypothetical protein